MSNKHIRMVTGMLKPGRLDETVERWRTAVAPSARTQKGYVSARLMVDRAANRVRSMGVWESEADYIASIPWNQVHVASFAQLFARPPTIDNFDLVAELEQE